MKSTLRLLLLTAVASVSLAQCNPDTTSIRCCNKLVDPSPQTAQYYRLHPVFPPGAPDTRKDGLECDSDPGVGYCIFEKHGKPVCCDDNDDALHVLHQTGINVACKLLDLD